MTQNNTFQARQSIYCCWLAAGLAVADRRSTLATSRNGCATRTTSSNAGELAWSPMYPVLKSIIWQAMKPLTHNYDRREARPSSVHLHAATLIEVFRNVAPKISLITDGQILRFCRWYFFAFCIMLKITCNEGMFVRNTVEICALSRISIDVKCEYVTFGRRNEDDR